MLKDGKYPGINNDLFGGMTDVGAIIRDAWALDVLPETETCEGWGVGQIQILYEQVCKAWEPYQHMPFLLPPEIKEKYIRIQDAASRRARELGWEPPMESDGT
jgi:hypothetical protein